MQSFVTLPWTWCGPDRRVSARLPASRATTFCCYLRRPHRSPGMRCRQTFDELACTQTLYLTTDGANDSRSRQQMSVLYTAVEWRPRVSLMPVDELDQTAAQWTSAKTESLEHIDYRHGRILSRFKWLTVFSSSVYSWDLFLATKQVRSAHMFAPYSTYTVELNKFCTFNVTDTKSMAYCFIVELWILVLYVSNVLFYVLVNSNQHSWLLYLRQVTYDQTRVAGKH